MSKGNVLYVEDEPDYQELVARILRKAGLATKVAGNGKQGMELLAQERPKLLILDINLPDTDGYSICKQLRGETAWMDLPILMLTVRKRPEEWLNGFKCGADDYVSKPLNPPEFLERIQSCLSGNGVYDADGHEKAEFLLIQSAVSGNRGAFDVLVRRYQKSLMSAISELIANPEDVEDIASCVLIRALERLKEFRGESGFYSWLYEIAQHEIHRRSRHSSMVSLDEISDDEEGKLPESLVEPDKNFSNLDRKADAKRVRKVLRYIPEPWREALQCNLLDGTRYGEMAQKLGIEEGTAFSRVSRAKRFFRVGWRRNTH